MSAPGPTSGPLPDDVLRVFEESEPSVTPLTTNEIADEVGGQLQATQATLEKLRERGALRCRTVADQRIWWPIMPDSVDSQLLDRHPLDETSLSELLLETVPVSISAIKPTGELVRANSRALDRLGIQESDLNQYRIDSWEIYDEEGELIPYDETPWADIVNTGEAVRDYECQVQLPELGRRWLSVNASALHNADGDYIIFAVDDITEQKEREHQLRRERNQTRELLQTAPIAISVRDADGTTVMANERAQDLLDLSEQEILNEPLDINEWRIFDADGTELSPDEAPSARVHATGEPVFDEEIIIERPDGEQLWVAISAAPVFDADGDLERVITTGEDISELKRRERALEQRRAELETELFEILGRISDAFYALDDEWRFTHVNDQAEELLQHPREALLGEQLWDVFPDAVGDVFWERFRAAMETNNPVSFEYKYDELDIWIEVNAYPSESGLSVYFQDITGRKEREQELERYRTIVEAVDDGIYTVDPDGYFTMVNEAYVEMTGYPREELLGSHVSLVVDDEVADQAQDWEAELAAGEQGRAMVEAELIRADGGTVPAEATFALFTSEASYERIGVVRDITERKARQRALEESERRYRTLVDNFPDGAVGLFDDELRYTAVGGQLLDQVGLEPEDRIGQYISEAYPEEIVEEYGGYFEAVFAGEANSFEAEFHGLHLYNQTLPVTDANGEIIAGMLVAQDISERIEYRNQLEETVEELEESNERLEQFAYIASHDLQEPLRMITSYLNLLEDHYGDELDEQAQEFMEYAVDGSERMRTMVQDLLTYSRLDTDAEPFDPTDLESVVTAALDNLTVQIEERRAEIDVGSLPTVEADANQLEQVFRNLVSNAIKYCEADPPRVKIGAEPVDGMVRFSVADNGIGMDPAYTDQIFEVFKRLHNDDEYPGTGIGLSLCRKIVERHGGDIWVDSAPGEGSMFYFTIPRASGNA